MSIIELFLISVGLAMDAFAVAVCKGLAMKILSIKKIVSIGVWFGVFQAGMPAIGYLLGSNFKVVMESISHFIAFILLFFIGFKMLKDVFCGEESTLDDSLNPKRMFILAVATSIDALTIGVTFAFFDVNILIAAIMIGLITFTLSMLGVIIGNKFGHKYEKKAQITGGIILICLALKNLLEHFSII